MNLVLEAGAADLQGDEDSWTILSEPGNHDAVVAALEKAKIAVESAEIAMVPKNLVKLEGKHASAMLRMMEVFEDHDDVQNVYSNFDIDDDEMESM